MSNHRVPARNLLSDRWCVRTAAIVLLAAALPAAGQYGATFRGNRTTDTLDRTLTTGRLLGRPGGGISGGGGGGGGGISRGGFADARSAAVNFRGRTGGGSALNFAGTGALGRGGGTMLMMPFGRSPSAYSYSGAVFSGRVGYAPSMAPGFGSESIIRILRGDYRLIGERSFHHIAFLPRSGGAIRDELTNTSIANSPPIDEEAVAALQPQPSPAERMSTLLGVRRERYLAQAWQAMRDGDFRRADGYFKNAETLDHAEPEPLVGRLLCAVFDDRVITAGTLMERMVKRQADLFEVRPSLAEILEGEAMPAIPFERLDNWLLQQRTSASHAALRSYLYWLAGQDEKALSGARTAQDAFRGTVFSDFAERMESRLADEQAAAEGA